MEKTCPDLLIILFFKSESDIKLVFLSSRSASADTLNRSAHAGTVGLNPGHVLSLTSLYCSRISETTSKSSRRVEFWSDNLMDSESLEQMTCCTGPTRCCFRPRKTANLDTERLSMPTCEPNSSALSYQPGMNEIRPLQPSAGVLSAVGRSYTHTRSYSRSACAKQLVISRH